MIVNNRAYHRGELIQEADGLKLEVLDEQYVKDDRHVYYQGVIIDGADPETFQYDEKKYTYRDKNHEYREGKKWNREAEAQSSTREPVSVLKADLSNTTFIAPQSFKVLLTSKKEDYKKGEDIILRMSVKNISEQTDKFCIYHTPFEGIQNNIFTVLKGSKEISYLGKMKKRVPPSSKDYMTLKPNDLTKCEVVLEGYDLSKKGTYNLQFAGNLISGLPSSNMVQISVR